MPITVSNGSLRFLVKCLSYFTQNSLNLSATDLISDNRSFFTCLGFICDILVIKIYLITRTAFATSLSFNSESSLTILNTCQLFFTKKTPALFLILRSKFRHLNLMTLGWYGTLFDMRMNNEILKEVFCRKQQEVGKKIEELEQQIMQYGDVKPATGRM